MLVTCSIDCLYETVNILMIFLVRFCLIRLLLFTVDLELKRLFSVLGSSQIL